MKEMIEFSPTWYTIPEFADEKPLCMYHKELESGTQKNNGIQNFHVLARADFCAKADVRYELLISADDYYKLYVNGSFVTQGPASAYPEHYYYNRIDITPFLVEGHNIIAVHLYYQGLINRVWNSGDNRFGIGAQIYESGALSELDWRYKVSHAYSGVATGYDTQFLENFDSREWEDNWAHLDYEDADFTPMVVAKWADYRFFEQPTKQLAIYKKYPAKMWEEISGSKRILHIDMGEEMTGSLGIQAKGTSGETIEIRCGEELDAENRVRYEMRCNCCYRERWTLRQGENLLEQYDYKGFRYVELIYDAQVEICDLWVQVRHYPLEEQACVYRGQDEKLASIFELCKRTVKYGTQESYLDCPTREKGQYLGDAIVTAHAQVLLSGTTEMLRKCIADFAFTSKICPGLMAVAPGAFMQEIADYSLLFSQLLVLDYQFTKDKDFLREYYPVAQAILEHFSKYEGEDGLLYHVVDKWNLVDWPENLRDGYDFELTRPIVAEGCHNVVNALYIGAMKTLAMIEGILDIPQSFDWEVRWKRFCQAFYNKETGLFVDCAKDACGNPSVHSSVHSNIYPLYFGFVDADEAKPMVELIHKKGLCCGVYTSYFLLKGLIRVGRQDVAYELLTNETEHGWMNMLREGATTCYEAWGKEQKWNTSLCHPWACAPIAIIMEDFA